MKQESRELSVKYLSLMQQGRRFGFKFVFNSLIPTVDNECLKYPVKIWQVLLAIYDLT